LFFFFFFFFKQKTAYEIRACDWSSDVCSSDLDDMILDIGPKSVVEILGKLAGVRTLVWNGPVGAFEVPPFDAGTVALAKGVAELTAKKTLESFAGGGDTLAALHHAGVIDRFSYVSTAGGAFLEWLEGKPLPGVEALRIK